VYVVNKADRDGADATVRDLKSMLGLGGRHSEAGAWRPPIVKTVASRGEGVGDAVDAIERHRAWMDAHGELTRRREARATAEVSAIAMETLRDRIGDLRGGTALERLAAGVATGKLDPYAAADELLAGLDAT
jgi:LAO/AO transport system kinase